MENITFNISGKTVRNATLYGRPHLVAPLTMIVEGVLNGSQGPLFYPKEELEKATIAWNGTPIVLYHPTTGTAKDPDVLNSSGLGTILNAKMDGAALKAEGWFDQQRLEAVAPSLLTALNSGQKIELSTGLGIDAEVPTEENPQFNGKPYSHIARNHKPDHLAILPDQIGACSVNDGCGVFNVLNVENKKVLFKVSNLDISHDELHSLLSTKMRSTRTQDQPRIWIEYVYDAYFIFEENGKLFKQAYTKTTSGVDLTGSPQEVIRETNFVVISNEENDPMSTEGKNVTNCSCDDDKILNGLSPEQKALFDKMQADNKALQAKVKNAEAPKQEEPKEETPAPAKVDNTKPMTAEAWLQTAPPEIRQVVQNAMDSEKQARIKLIGELTEGLDEATAKTLVDNVLGSKSLQELTALKALKPAPQPKQVNYGGAIIGNDSGNKQTEITNEELILPLPVIDFAETKAS